MGLVKVRRTRFGETVLEEGHKLWFSGEESKHAYGGRFLVREEVARAVLNFSPISNRLIAIRIAARPHNLTFIQALLLLMAMIKSCFGAPSLLEY